jgi:hypothetical protein
VLCISTCYRFYCSSDVLYITTLCPPVLSSSYSTTHHLINMGFKAILEKIFGCFTPQRASHNYPHTSYMSTPYQPLYSAPGSARTTYHEPYTSLGKTTLPNSAPYIHLDDSSYIPEGLVSASSIYSQSYSLPHNPSHDQYYGGLQYAGWVSDLPTQQLLRLANELPTPHYVVARKPRAHIETVEWGY